MTSREGHTPGEVGHTPLPWAIAPSGVFNDGGAHIVFPASETGVDAWNFEYVAQCGHGDRAWADAALIVRAVNSHAALLEALQMALDDSEVMAPDGRPLCVSPETLQRMRAALARAGGSKPKEQL